MQAGAEKQLLAEQTAYSEVVEKRVHNSGFGGDPDKAPPTKLKGIFRCNCFDSDCNHKKTEIPNYAYKL